VTEKVTEKKYAREDAWLDGRSGITRP